VRIFAGLGFVLVAAFVTKGVLALFPVWLFGVALAMVKPAKLTKSTRWIAVVLYVPCILKLALTQWPWHYFKMDYFLGALTSVFLWVMLSANGRVDESALAVRLSRRLARFSYSLYLVHYPMLLFFAAILTREGPWMPTPRLLATAAALCVLAMIYAYCVASATEFHNDQVRRWVEARLHWPR
jgi:peptidoglycan/LPS O-acetylase OafA/YrhL